MLSSSLIHLLSLHLINFSIVFGDLLCSEQYCQSYCEQKRCPQLSNGCQIQNETYNGEVFPAAVPCNCCDVCLENIEENGYCTIGSSDAAPPLYVCGPGLYCERNGTEDDYKCRKMTHTACFKEQIAYDTQKSLGQIGFYMQRPNCNGDGKYQPIKCHPGQTCFCIDEDGNRIFGESLHSLYTELTMKCECSRLNNKLLKLLPSRFATMTARCLEDGSYDPLQCMGDQCLCVNENDGFSKTDIFNVTEVGFPKLPCFNVSLHRKWIYHQDCELILDEYIAEFQKSEADGYTILKSNSQNCQPDGWFQPVQENTTYKYCVDKYGRKLDGYAVLKKNAGDINCLCARTVDIIRKDKQREMPQCCPNGNFKTVQCRESKCFCVDRSGLQITKEVNATKISSLPCYNNGKNC